MKPKDTDRPALITRRISLSRPVRGDISATSCPPFFERVDLRPDNCPPGIDVTRNLAKIGPSESPTIEFEVAMYNGTSGLVEFLQNLPLASGVDGQVNWEDLVTAAFDEPEEAYWVYRNVCADAIDKFASMILMSLSRRDLGKTHLNLLSLSFVEGECDKRRRLTAWPWKNPVFINQPANIPLTAILLKSSPFIRKRSA